MPSEGEFVEPVNATLIGWFTWGVDKFFSFLYFDKVASSSSSVHESTLFILKRKSLRISTDPWTNLWIALLFYSDISET